MQILKIVKQKQKFKTREFPTNFEDLKRIASEAKYNYEEGDIFFYVDIEEDYMQVRNESDFSIMIEEFNITVANKKIQILTVHVVSQEEFQKVDFDAQDYISQNMNTSMVTVKSTSYSGIDQEEDLLGSTDNSWGEWMSHQDKDLNNSKEALELIRRKLDESMILNEPSIDFSKEEEAMLEEVPVDHLAQMFKKCKEFVLLEPQNKFDQKKANLEEEEEEESINSDEKKEDEQKGLNTIQLIKEDFKNLFGAIKATLSLKVPQIPEAQAEKVKSDIRIKDDAWRQAQKTLIWKETGEDFLISDLGHECSKCSKQLNEPYYRCLICRMNILCEDCESSGAHCHHPMVKFNDLSEKADYLFLNQNWAKFTDKVHSLHESKNKGWNGNKGLRANQ